PLSLAYTVSLRVLHSFPTRRSSDLFQAQMSTIVAAFARIRQGKDPVKPKTSLSFAANFLYMLNGEEAENIEIDAMNKALVLHARSEEHTSELQSRFDLVCRLLLEKK